MLTHRPAIVESTTARVDTRGAHAQNPAGQRQSNQVPERDARAGPTRSTNRPLELDLTHPAIDFLERFTNLHPALLVRRRLELPLKLRARQPQ